MLTLLWFGIIGGILSLAGGLLILWRSQLVMKSITPLLAFAAGAFMGVGFLDLLPEAVESAADTHTVFIAALAGFAAFFALERVLMKYFHEHRDAKEEHRDHTESLALLVVLGDSLHNFLDGVVIALAYFANPALGLTTALGVAAHELPQEIGDFAILLDRGWPKSRIFFVNLVSSLMTIVGAWIGYTAAMKFQNWLAYLLAATAGIFIYIAASSLIPEIHHRAGHKHLYRVLAFYLLGIVLVGYMVTWAH